MVEDLLERALQLAHEGKAQEAHALLESIINSEVHNVQAWLWYAKTCATPAERREALDAALHYNPDDPSIREILGLIPGSTPQGAKPARPKPAAAVSFQDPSIVNAIQAAAASGASEVPSAAESKSKSGGKALWILAVAAILLIGLAAAAAWLVFRPAPIATAVDPANYRHVGTVEYYLYVPKQYTVYRDWPLFIGIHGSGGSGLDCWNWWQPYADREGFILLCPSIADSQGGWYQAVGESKVFSAINEVRAQYRVAPKEFMAGFSAGAQFVQGFAFTYPQYVSGVAILSAGNYYFPSMAPQIPMLVVIGSLDDPGAVAAAADFSAALKQNGFDIQYEQLPGVGHALTSRGQQLTIELFRRTQTQ